MDESDVLQDQIHDSISLLNQAQRDHQQSAINQLTSSTNLAHQKVKGKGKDKGANAMEAAFQLGYALDTTTYGGGQSSSSGTQPMETENVQQKRSELGDTGGEENKKTW